MLQDDFDKLVKESAQYVQDYKIPEDHVDLFNTFKGQYETVPDLFFQNINQTETNILSQFSKKEYHFIDNKLGENYLSDQEIKKFTQGDILQKSVKDIDNINKIKIEIKSLLARNNPLISAKYLHFLSPKLIEFIYKNRKNFFQPIISLFNSDQDVSFEFGYFNVPQKSFNPYWHDDYTIFKNEIRNPKEGKSLILNCHIALSDVTEKSSPLCFIKGTENIVYARSALKFFTDQNIKFDKNLFLKSTYLAEKLYVPGQKIKANFIGLIPNYSYRLHQLKNSIHKMEIFFKESKQGDFLIFSPNYMHTSPYVNTQKVPRESMVLRCLEDDYYNYRNIITCGTVIQFISFALGKRIYLDQIKNILFKGYENINLDTKIYSNLYIRKPNNQEIKYNHPRLYLDDFYDLYKTKYS